ncbi:MAG: peptidoglycan DD-metalloendopeptidase family protein [Deltaproteobacteria bacterium]|nr:peptidoglycan DD-metalloendopeptidase family protein [Candidatus Zymogenaceae bacterium]
MIKKSYFSIIIAGDRSERAHTFRTITLSNITLLFLGIIFLAALVGSGFMFHTYLNTSVKIREISSLKQENGYLKDQLDEFKEAYGRISACVESVEKMDEQLRVLAAVGEPKTQGELFGVGGPTYGEVSLKELERRHDDLADLVNQDLDRLLAESKRQEESFNELTCFLEGQRNVMDCTPAVWPTRGFLSSKFGMRWGRLHAGIDIANKVGTIITAPADGIVIFIGVKQGYGNFMTIAHGYGISTNYGHLYSALVNVGDNVKRGDKVATIGNSGRTTGPHLHYEVLVNGVHVDPLYYILN